LRTNSIKDVRTFLHGFAKYPLKYALICAVAIETGFRVSDILNIKKRDITQNKGVLREKKTQKRREFKISDGLREEIETYAKENGLRSEDFLFPSTANNRAKHIGRTQVYKVFKQVADSVKELGNISPHSCRKTYARLRYSEHGDIERLQRDFGHYSIETTKGYLEG
jgi:integrase